MSISPLKAVQRSAGRPSCRHTAYVRILKIQELPHLQDGVGSTALGPHSSYHSLRLCPANYHFYREDNPN